MKSWEMVLSSFQQINIRADNVTVCVRENMAMVTCLEVIDAADSQGVVAATNVFELQDSHWRMIHHHGGPVPTQRA